MAQTRRPTGPTPDVDWAKVDQALGRTGTMEDAGVHKFSIPRSDLAITVRGVRIKPALALGGWLAMKPNGDSVVAMGDLVLTDAEVSSVIGKLEEGRVMVTALHNHLPGATPNVMYLHVHAEGDPVHIAQTVRAALATSKTPPGKSPPREAPGAPGMDTAAIGQALGRGGKLSGGVYHVTIPRAETIHAGEIDVPASMGTATALNFQPTGGGKAAINGDFVMTGDEVNKVIRALRQGGIDVVALHNHMLAEEPRLFFMHFWANGDAVELARGLRSALDQTNIQRSAGR